MNNDLIISDERVQELLKNPILVQRALNDKSLYEFLIWAWPELSGQPFTGNWHIEYLCRELEEVAYRVGNRLPKKHDLLINVPPGSTKTILCTIVFPVWCWTRWFWMRFITASYSSILSMESSQFARDLIRSERFREVYPELSIKSDKDSKSNYAIVKRVPSQLSDYHFREKTGGYRYSSSVGGTITGFHADIIIWDDPLNPHQAASEKEVETANRWMDETIPTRKTDKAISVTIGIMQRVHENDPSGHLLAKQKGNVRHLCFPGEIRNYRRFLKPEECARFYKDDLFDHRRLTWMTLNDLEQEMGQYGYAGQIGQNPAPPGGGMFKVDHFQLTSQLFTQNEIVKTVRYWDKAIAVGKSAGSYTVGVKMSLMRDGTYLIDDVKRGKWGALERESIILQTAIADGLQTVILLEQEPGSGGKESVEATIRNLAGFVAYADRPTGLKEVRADPFSVQVNNGNVKLRTAMWNRDFIEEFKLFPNSTYKDQVDAASAAFNYVVQKRTARAIGRRK